jgi:diguanylate cyclase (GGDEF)-like protein/PAS domain S-box-containing protein
MATVDAKREGRTAHWPAPGGWRSAAIAPFRAAAEYFRVVADRLRGDKHCFHAYIAERRRLKEQQRLSARVIASIADGIMVTDARRRLVFVNAAFSRVTGYSADEALGRTPSMLRSGRQDAAFYAEMWRRIDETGHWQGEIWNRRKQGEIYPELLSVSAVRNADGEIVNYVGVFNDISASKRYEERLHHLAHHDALTGLANRVLFEDRFREAIGRARRQDQQVAVLFLDLDYFKKINDTLGHDVGDLLLQTAAQRILENVREIDTVARFGGDEFAVLLEVIDNHEGAGTVARKLIDVLALPFQIDGRQLRISASIGIGCFPQDGAEPEALIKNADTAMYRAKTGGRNNYRFFSESMNEPALETRPPNGLPDRLDTDQAPVSAPP